MESYKELKFEELSNKLKKDFPIKELVFGELLFGGVIPIVFVSFETLNDLNKNWKDFNGQISTDFVINLKEEYSRWNFYIFYLSNESIEKQLKYEIENNKFSSRKIVIENVKFITEKEINLLISEHITNDNMQIGVENKQSLKFKKNTSLSKILDKLSLNKKSDDDLQDALDSIEKIYKNEI
ncbi:MAG: ABC-three component system middle component 1 [Bacteroidia bacterium]